jgi:hypothetical protein
MTMLVLVVLAGQVNAEGFDVADVLEVATENAELGGLGPRQLEKLCRPLDSPLSLDSRDTTADKSSDPPLLEAALVCARCCCPRL